MVSALAAIPLLLTVLFATGLALYALKRKSLAQSICVQQASILQNNLKGPLLKLLKMNTQAKILRARRTVAEARLVQALASGHPAVIAAAKLARDVVVLEQTAFHSKQLALLNEAQRLRAHDQRELRRRVSLFPAAGVSTPASFPLALAVEPVPATSPSPDYVPVPGFEYAQQQSFEFSINVAADFPFVRDFVASGWQTSRCSVTLSERSGQWALKILAAKAP